VSALCPVSCRSPTNCWTRLAEALRACGADPRVVRLSYDHTTALANTATVEGYLQRCVFDDSVSLPQMMTAPRLGA
jgi:hypothetical protein